MIRWFGRSSRISLFVILWIAVFHYETLRLHYLSPLAGRELPKLKFLYPPAGWVMFYHVDSAQDIAEVYGIRNNRAELIDPHDIFETRFVWYDNIHRGVLFSVFSPSVAPRFCRFLSRKFPQYEDFFVAYQHYPDVTARTPESRFGIRYRCR